MMVNFSNKKNKRLMSGIIIGILILTMVVTTIFAAMAV